ncbi:uncharacterized protein APUU_61144A [Aspergillus puulaauensis]|uniref:Alpha/Beta hydrolase protein n=1 Tax=Aspergillus puulaauensis TaxID=1220207 RepID=A0A7R7XUQ4_9EURO|nr:uncharacterized protein APUU_61144A [Aspergillus puulaauensis]BCS28096.1 hypothetical protein APUU_61144A [Aspergillus puulaauensis]
MGGMTALEWPLCAPPGFVKLIIPIATSAAQTAWGIAWSEIQRQCIYSDPLFHGGYYDPNQQPKSGIATAPAPACTSTGNPTRRLFSAQDYLDYQGSKFVRRFDANCYLHLTHKMDMHDVRRGRVYKDYDPHFNDESTPPPPLATVLSGMPPPTLVVGIESDVLFLLAQQHELAAGLPDATLTMLKSFDGHYAFLLEFEQPNHLIIDRLKRRFPGMYEGFTERVAEINMSHLAIGVSVSEID